MIAVKEIRGWDDKVQVGTKAADKLGFRDKAASTVPTYTTSNVTTDRSIDADAAVAVIGDGLCTLIEDLKTLGILQ